MAGQLAPSGCFAIRFRRVEQLHFADRPVVNAIQIKRPALAVLG